MEVTIRPIDSQAMLDVQYRLAAYAFHSSPPLYDKEEWQRIISQRKDVSYLALYEDEQAVATVAGSSMTQQVRGALFPMSGIWGVITAPAARRKGYSRRLLTRLLAVARDAGRPFSTLYPFRESFYERLGYVTFPLAVKTSFHPAALSPILRKELPGAVSTCLLEEGLDDYIDFVRRLQVRTHGMALFDHVNKEHVKRFPNWLALARVGGETVGVMTYRLQGDGPTLFKMTVGRFYYSTAAGRYLLLDWIARHIDQANLVEMSLSPNELPETWLADMAVHTETAIRAPMGRVLDVAKIAGMNTGSGSFTFRLIDEYCPWQDGSWRFETIDGRLQVSSITDAGDADCNLQIQGLSALIYGTHDPGSFAIREWGDPDAALQETMRSMFPPQRPYLHEHF